VFKLAGFPVRMLKLLGEDLVYSSDADVAKCCSLIFSAIDFKDFDLVYFEGLDARSPLWDYCSASNGKPSTLRFVRPNHAKEKSFQIHLPRTFEEYLTSLGSGTRYSRKRSARILATDHGATLVKITSADQVRSFLKQVDEIYCDSWQSKTYGHWKRDSEEEIAQFENIARHGWLRSYLLTSNQGPMAFLIGYFYNDTYYVPAWAFAQRWASLGPGAVLVYLTIEDLYNDTPPKLVDLGYGESAIKRSFRGLPHDVGDYYVVPRNRWRYLIAAQRCLSDVEAGVRNVLVRTGSDRAVRRLLKRKSSTPAQT
jgi:hypothetical protein